MGAVPRTIYFFLIPEGVSRDNYAHNALVLAEGLKELGWSIYANINYWREGPEDNTFLFKRDPNVTPKDCQVNVLTYDWMHFVNAVPYELSENGTSVRVYLEDAGWLRTPGTGTAFRQFEYVLKSHFNVRTTLPSNYRPWSFGLSNRIIREVRNSTPFANRRRAVLVNFGVTHLFRHELRETWERRVYPLLSNGLEIDRTTNKSELPPSEPYHRMMWEQTAGRHYPDYYERLKTTVACSCVGGRLVAARPRDWSLFQGGDFRAAIKGKGWQLASRILREPARWNQWESWRWWESLAAGCASLMLDFDKYGVQLPVQPRNWTHYAGIDLDALEVGIERLFSELGLLERIAKQGKDWAFEHYAPRPTAMRFLDALGIPR